MMLMMQNTLLKTWDVTVVIILFFFIVFHYRPSFSVLGPIIIARYETGPKQVAEKDI
jgi:hypothetical protein